MKKVLLFPFVKLKPENLKKVTQLVEDGTMILTSCKDLQV